MKRDRIINEDFNPDSLGRSTSNDKSKTFGVGKKSSDNVSDNKNTKDKKTSSFMSFMRDKRTHIVLGVTLICIAIYMLIASISYISNAGEDQSLVQNFTIEQLAQTPDKVNNAAGPTGAIISHNLISEGIGIGIFPLIFLLIACGLTLFKVVRFKFWSLLMKCLITAISTSIITGLLTYKTTSIFYWGGIHGYEVNHFLITNASIWGAIGVSIILATTCITLFANYIHSRYTIYANKIKAKRAQIQAEKEKAEKARQSVVNSLSESDNHQNDDLDSIDTTNTGYVFNDNADNDNNSEDIAHQDLNVTTLKLENTPTEDNINISMDIITNEIEEADRIVNDVYDPTAELSRYRFPSIELLNDISLKNNSVDQQEQEENKERITKTLNDYGISISHIEATVGPTVTLYEIIPAEGVRIAKVKRLEEDIQLSLAALGIRIIAPIPGKGTIGIEVPNKDPQMVSMRSIISSRKYQESKYELPIAMGATISKEVFIADLAKMPHLLVAGATGMGKSVGLNAIITSLLYKKHPSQLKFVLVDPKMVEFSLYSKLEKHYLAKLPEEEDPIITDTSKVVATLNSLCVEMDNRYSLLKEAGQRNILEYNEKFIQRRLNPDKGHRYLPYIVIIVDEFGDLIMTAGKEVETPIARIAQKARAVGMHMILATQRPSTNIITGIIKANFPGRIAFRVAQMVDSRTILDRTGANRLIGKGDMLFSHNGELERIQCAFISTSEVEAIVDSIDSQIGYPEAYPLPDYIPDNETTNGSIGNVNDRDPLFDEAARWIVQSNTASTSSLQRRYSIGYNRAGKIMDQMEAAGIVGPASGAKPRPVLIDSLQLERMLEIN